MKKKSFYIVVGLSVILFFQILEICKDKGIAVFNIDINSKEGITNELIIALFMEDINLAVDQFYEPYFSGGLQVFPYEISIEEISKKDNSITITFGVPPEIGAHNPVGYDEITYSVDPLGAITLVSFNHIKSYEVPEHLKNYVIKPLP